MSRCVNIPSKQPSVQERRYNIIPSTTAQDLRLRINKGSGSKDNKLDTVLKKHEQLFHRLGKLKGEKVKLNVNKKDQTTD